MGSKTNKSMSRSKTQKRKRWKKGQSSSSNPLSKKFREAAKSRFFSPSASGSVNESSSLTVDALAKHDETQTDEDGDEFMFGGDAGSIGATTSGHTFKTWASNWTECTNSSFNNVHRYWASNDALHREILAVLAAVTEVIKAQGGNETETEYFGALVTTLKLTEGEQSLSAVAYLLSLVLKRVPVAVLKSRFSEVSKTILDLLAQHADGASSSLLKSLLICLALVLRVQERAVWNNSSTHQVYRGLLTFVTHKKPKVRKSAHRAVCIVLKGSLFMLGGETTAHHPAATITAKHCITQIETSGGSESSVDTLYILGLLKDILGVLPQSSVKSLCETILRVLTLGSVMVITCGMQALHGLFSSHPKSSTLPPDLNAQLITALYDYQPAENDAQPMQAWLTVMEKAHTNLSRLDDKLCISHLPRIFSTGMTCLLSDKTEVAHHATKILKRLVQSCLGVEHVKSMTESTVTSLQKVVRALESGLSYQFHTSWGLVLQLFAAVIEAVGKYCPKLFPKSLSTIAELRESPRFQFKGELDHAIGWAVRVLGPRLVLESVPLKITGEIDDTSFSRSWMLPVFRDSIRETELGFFTAYFLPLAARLRQRAEQLENEDNVALAQTYDTLQLQIWSLLPGFCTSPTDLAQAFRGIAKVLGSAITDRPDLRMQVMFSLRKLVTHSLENAESKQEISQFSKNFLPLFFNLYTTEVDEDKENSRLAVLETVKCYLQITSSELILAFCDRCIEKMNEESITPFRRHALVDLATTMVPYVDMAHLNQICHIAVSNLQTTDKTLQKKCYKVLEIICKCPSDDSKQFVTQNIAAIQKVLLESLSTSSPSSKAPRLRCLISIFQQLGEQESFLKAVIPEAVLCTREIGERARTAAYALLVEMGRAAVRWSENSLQGGLPSYIGLVLSGLTGSPQMASSTLLALTRILYEFKNDIAGPVLETIIDNVCHLLLSKSREIVKSALGFIKVLVAAYPDTTLACYLKQMMSSLVGMQEDCRHHFRFKAKEVYTKLIRKFGYETIYGMASSNTQKVLVNIHKTQERTKRRKKEEEQEEKEEEEEHFRTLPESIDEMLKDTDSEMEEDVKKTKVNKQKKPGKKQGKAWLTEAGEDIIDFLDPATTKKVVATKPSEKDVGGKNGQKDHGFKKASDGRLIITEDDDEGAEGNEEDDGELDELLEAFESGKRSKSRGKKRKMEDIDPDSEAQSKPKYQAGGHGIHRPLQKSQKETKYGAEYKAKKAGGDIKKKGKHEPYVYLPLNIQSLNKRKQAKMQGQFKNIVRGAKKGALKGMKGRKKKH